MSTFAILPVSPYPPPSRGRHRKSERGQPKGCGPSRMWGEASREGWHRRPVVDPAASIRAKLTPALRRACETLAELETRGRFPARYRDVWAALARITKNRRKRAHHIAQTLVDKLVELGVLFLFDRKRQKLDVTRPGIFAELLRQPPQDLRFGD